ncbi:MAG: 1-acyl-sn-glycerol-3-phosphate acyltransferase, partial [Clostridia bacterium]|nr:1-acyl-sn-glycerol-3-phosphate acyltransferase [Clostridia bacterium]
IKNKKVLKKVKGSYFLYSNHTLMAGDAFHPSIIGLGKKTHIIVGPDTVSIKGLQNVVKMLGAVPLPTTFGAAKNYVKAVDTIYKEGNPIAIYPEAHIWPYCSFIRPFKKGSCKYPVELNAPVFIAVTTYQKRLFFKYPKVTIYVDGPYYADETLSKTEAEEKLRNLLQDEMTKIMKQYNTYEYIKYVKIEK